MKTANAINESVKAIKLAKINESSDLVKEVSSKLAEALSTKFIKLKPADIDAWIFGGGNPYGDNMDYLHGIEKSVGFIIDEQVDYDRKKFIKFITQISDAKLAEKAADALEEVMEDE